MSKTPRTIIASTLGAQSLEAKDSKIFAKSIAAYLLDAGRGGELSSIMRDVSEYRAGRGIVEVTATTAHPLSAEARAQIENQVEKIYPGLKQIIINEQIDPQVLSGVRLEFANAQLDLTARAKLNKLKKLTA